MADELRRLLGGEGGESSKLLAALIDQMAEEKVKEKSWSLDRAAERVGSLRHRFELLTESYRFREGDIVRWKPELKNRKKPEYGEPAIVLELLMDPVYDSERSSGSAYFREPLDIVLGLLDDDDELMFFYFDRRRFEPFDSLIVMGDNE